MAGNISPEPKTLVVSVYGVNISNFGNLDTHETERYLTGQKAFVKWRSQLNSHYSFQPSMMKINVVPFNDKVLMNKCSCKSFSNCLICHLDTAYSRVSTNYHKCQNLIPCSVFVEKIPDSLKKKELNLGSCGMPTQMLPGSRPHPASLNFGLMLTNNKPMSVQCDIMEFFSKTPTIKITLDPPTCYNGWYIPNCNQLSEVDFITDEIAQQSGAPNLNVETPSNSSGKSCSVRISADEAAPCPADVSRVEFNDDSIESIEKDLDARFSSYDILSMRRAHSSKFQQTRHTQILKNKFTGKFTKRVGHKMRFINHTVKSDISEFTTKYQTFTFFTNGTFQETEDQINKKKCKQTQSNFYVTKKSVEPLKHFTRDNYVINSQMKTIGCPNNSNNLQNCEMLNEVTNEGLHHELEGNIFNICTKDENIYPRKYDTRSTNFCSLPPKDAGGFDKQVISRTCKFLINHAKPTKQNDFQPVQQTSQVCRGPKHRTESFNQFLGNKIPRVVLKQCLPYRKRHKVNFHNQNSNEVCRTTSDVENVMELHQTHEMVCKSMANDDSTKNYDSLTNRCIQINLHRLMSFSTSNGYKTRDNHLATSSTFKETTYSNLMNELEIDVGKSLPPPNSLVCSLCKVEYESFFHLIDHIRCHQKRKIYLCYFCQKRFEKRSYAKKHMRTHTGVRPYKCNACNKTFTQSCSRNRHQQTHSDIKFFLCNYCDQRFRRESHLTTHLLTHTGKKFCICTVCGDAFSRQFCLKIHMNLHSGNDLHQCRHCQHPCDDTSTLKKHERRHTGDKPYLCFTCGDKYVDTAGLSSHLSCHSEIIPHQCKDCSVSCKTLQIRPHQCNDCSVSCKTLRGLKIHSTIHRNKAQYQCKICGKKFNRKSNLITHEVIHKNVFPFACEHCPRKFRRKGCLTKHMKVHTRGTVKTVHCDNRD